MVNLFCIRLIMSSLFSSLLIVIIYMIRKSLKKHLSMQWQYGIWFLLFMILILPFVPESLLELGKLKGWDLQTYSNSLNIQVTTNGINIAGEQLVSNNSWMQDFSLSVSRSPIVAYFSVGFVSI